MWMSLLVAYYLKENSLCISIPNYGVVDVSLLFLYLHVKRNTFVSLPPFSDNTDPKYKKSRQFFIRIPSSKSKPSPSPSITEYLVFRNWFEAPLNIGFI